MWNASTFKNKAALYVYVKQFSQKESKRLKLSLSTVTQSRQESCTNRVQEGRGAGFQHKADKDVSSAVRCSTPFLKTGRPASALVPVIPMKTQARLVHECDRLRRICSRPFTAMAHWSHPTSGLKTTSIYRWLDWKFCSTCGIKPRHYIWKTVSLNIVKIISST